MNPLAIRNTFRSAALCGAVLLLSTGCNKRADNMLNFASAINTYYNAHPACLWSEPQKFPVQAETSGTSKTSSYDALIDQGLLARTTAEKKKVIIASKRVNNYDISDKGRSAWTADVDQPSFGNFCYGHRKGNSIDSATPTTDAVGATTQVSYHYTFADAPAWAAAAEAQTAYPQVQTDLSGPQTGQATLTNTNSGWAVSSVPERHAATAADGSIVE